MKKFVVVLVAAIIAVSNASALKLGAFAGPSMGLADHHHEKYDGREVPKDKEFGFAVTFDIYGTLMHNFGDSNWFGQAEVGLLYGLGASYNAGYKFELAGGKFVLAPYAGVAYSIINNMGGNIGAELFIPLGIGDLTFDLRLTGKFNSFKDVYLVGIHAGYVFYLGKDKR